MGDPHYEAALHGLYYIPLYVGCAITIISCAIIIGTYFKFEELRRHPNGLVLLRCLFDLILAITVAAETSLRRYGYLDQADCRGFSFWIQLCTLGSELCFFCVSSDLFFALRNPFMNYKTSMVKYRLFAIIVAAAMAGGLVGAGDTVYGLTQFGVCWIKPSIESPINKYLWAFFYAPLFAVYIWSFSVLIYAARRLDRGLRETYEARNSSFRRGTAFVLGYTCYWTILAIVYWVSLSEDLNESMTPGASAFAFIFTSKGFATMTVWLYNHNLKEVAHSAAVLRALHGHKWKGRVNRQLQPHLNLALRKEILHYTTLAIRLSVVQAVGEQRIGAVIASLRSQLRAAKRQQPPSGDNNNSNENTNHNSSLTSKATIEHEAITARASVYAPYNDKSPTIGDSGLEVNWVPLDIGLYAPLFERGGIYDIASDLPDASILPSSSSSSKSAKESNTNVTVTNPVAGKTNPSLERRPEGTKQTGLKHSNSSAHIEIDGETGETHSHLTPTSADRSGVIKRPPVELYDLAPEVFGRIRDLCGITPAQYIYSLARTTKERFSEGASGAFMCFSWDMRFVIKSMEKDEADVLARILPAYLNHLRKNRDTLIVRFFGCMSLRLYRHTLYFVVMENMFPTKATIHERFDLKGSWVGRSASKGAPGTVAYCRFCNEGFRVGDKFAAPCRARPNRSCVPNTVLKDNDINFKLRLAPDKASRLASQLRSDVAFLGKMGVMDYSLLIGVHNRKFKIDSDGTLLGEATITTTATNPTSTNNNNNGSKSSSSGTVSNDVSNNNASSSQSNDGNHSNRIMPTISARRAQMQFMNAGAAYHPNNQNNNQPSLATMNGGNRSNSSGIQPNGNDSSLNSSNLSINIPVTPNNLSFVSSASTLVPRAAVLSRFMARELPDGGQDSPQMGSPYQSGGGGTQRENFAINSLTTSNSNSQSNSRVQSMNLSSTNTSLMHPSVTALREILSNNYEDEGSDIDREIVIPMNSSTMNNNNASMVGIRSGPYSRNNRLPSSIVNVSMVPSNRPSSSSLSSVPDPDMLSSSPPTAFDVLHNTNSTGMNNLSSSVNHGPLGAASTYAQRRMMLQNPQAIIPNIDAATNISSIVKKNNPLQRTMAVPPLLPHRAPSPVPIPGSSNTSSGNTLTTLTNRPPGVLQRHHHNNHHGNGSSRNKGNTNAIATTSVLGDPQQPIPVPQIVMGNYMSEYEEDNNDDERNNYDTNNQQQTHFLEPANPPQQTIVPVTNPTVKVPFFRADEGGMVSAIIEGPGVFYMGIIDILQEYNTIKRLERWLKSTVMFQSKKGMSVMPPEGYADRFERRVIAAVIEGGGAGGNLPVSSNVSSSSSSSSSGTGLNVNGVGGSSNSSRSSSNSINRSVTSQQQRYNNP